MKIFHVLKHASRGNGSVHVAVDLACEQARIGHDVYLLAAPGPYSDLLRRHGVTVSELPSAGGLVGALGTFTKLMRASLQVRPDVLHAHMMSSAAMGRLIAWLLPRTRLVTTVHNSFDTHSVIMRLGDVVVCVSEAEKELLLSRGFPERRLRVVLNGTGGSARDELPTDDIGELQQPSVLVVAGLHHRKGVNDVITAFAAARSVSPGWHLNIVGNGPDRQILESRVATEGLGTVVHFLGSTLTPIPLLESADIFVTGSLADPCPLAVIEARRAGCAVVGTSVGGIPEILEFGEAGVIVPPSDSAAMALALTPLMSDASTLSKWRSRSRDQSNYFTLARVAREYGELYALEQ